MINSEIIIKLDNLTQNEQVNLLHLLYKFALVELPHNKNLLIKIKKN